MAASKLFAQKTRDEHWTIRQSSADSSVDPSHLHTFFSISCIELRDPVLLTIAYEPIGGNARVNHTMCHGLPQKALWWQPAENSHHACEQG